MLVLGMLELRNVPGVWLVGNRMLRCNYNSLVNLISRKLWTYLLNRNIRLRRGKLVIVEQVDIS